MAAAVYQLPDLAVVGGEGVVKLIVRDKKNDTSNEFAVTVGETDKNFTFNFKVENIRIIPGSYDVVVSSKLLSKFSNSKLNLTYYIALEPDSQHLNNVICKKIFTEEECKSLRVVFHNAPIPYDQLLKRCC